MAARLKDTGRGGQKLYDIEDFSIEEYEHVSSILDSHYFHFTTSEMKVIFELKITCENLWKKKHTTTFTSSQLLLFVQDESITLTQKLKVYTSKLQEQHTIYMEVLEQARDF